MDEVFPTTHREQSIRLVPESPRNLYKIDWFLFIIVRLLGAYLLVIRLLTTLYVWLFVYGFLWLLCDRNSKIKF